MLADKNPEMAHYGDILFNALVYRLYQSAFEDAILSYYQTYFDTFLNIALYFDRYVSVQLLICPNIFHSAAAKLSLKDSSTIVLSISWPDFRFDADKTCSSAFSVFKCLRFCLSLLLSPLG